MNGKQGWVGVDSSNWLIRTEESAKSFALIRRLKLACTKFYHPHVSYEWSGPRVEIYLYYEWRGWMRIGWQGLPYQKSAQCLLPGEAANISISGCAGSCYHPHPADGEMHLFSEKLKENIIQTVVIILTLLMTRYNFFMTKLKGNNMQPVVITHTLLMMRCTFFSTSKYIKRKNSKTAVFS